MYNRELKVERFTCTELDAETLGDKKCYHGDTRDGFQHFTVVVFFVVDTSAGFRLTKFFFIFFFRPCILLPQHFLLAISNHPLKDKRLPREKKDGCRVPRRPDGKQRWTAESKALVSRFQRRKMNFLPGSSPGSLGSIKHIGS